MTCIAALISTGTSKITAISFGLTSGLFFGEAWESFAALPNPFLYRFSKRFFIIIIKASFATLLFLDTIGVAEVQIQGFYIRKILNRS